MIPDTNDSRMSFTEFQKVLAEVLMVNPEKLTSQAYFITDLAVDSIHMVELLLRMQDLGVTISPEAAWDIQTVGDAYDYYLRHTLA